MKRGVNRLANALRNAPAVREIKGLEMSVVALVETGHPLKGRARVFEKISER